MFQPTDPVLVTGASGFVGFHVVQTLLHEGLPVRALIRSTSRRQDLEALWASAKRSECEATATAAEGSCCVVGDIREAKSLQISADGCTALVHMAADYRLGARAPQELYQTNVVGTANVLQAAHRVGIRRVIYTSTVGTLGIPLDGSPGTEDTPVDLADMKGHYKRSKFLAEQMARRYAECYGIELIILHPSTPVGERDWKPTPTGRIILDFLRRRMPAYIDTGLNLVDVRDVAKGHVLALAKGRPGRSYILGNRNMTLREILRELADITGLPAPRVRLPYVIAYGIAVTDTLISRYLLGREPRVSVEAVRMASRKMFFSSERAVRELGMPQSSVTTALARAVAWYVAHGYCPAPPRGTADESGGS